MQLPWSHSPRNHSPSNRKRGHHHHMCGHHHDADPSVARDPESRSDSDTAMTTATPGSTRDGPRPSHWANDEGTAFKNPWDSAQAPTLGEMISGGSIVSWAKSHHALKEDDRSRDIKVVEPDWGEGKGATARDGRGDRFVKDVGVKHGVMAGTWLGHAGAFVEMPIAQDRHGKPRTAKFLFDPIFSGRAGPTQYTGPARYRASPCEVEDLPGCAAVFISHNHYDHLDYSSILSLLKRFPDLRYYVPLGNKKWFLDTGVSEDRIFEMDWWEDKELCPEGLGSQQEDEDPDAKKTSRVRITCVPAQHNSGRTGIDSGATLWCGWVIEHLVTSEASNGDAPKRVTRSGSLYFAGDTGYRRHRTSKAICPAFEEIGKKFGPFDLSFLPIWRGGSLGFVSWLGLRLNHENIPSALHGSPTDAVHMHLDVRSRNSIGIHFGTFIGAENESLEAVIELTKACEEAHVRKLEDRLPRDKDEEDNGRFGVVDLGETVVVEIEELHIVD